MSDIVTAIRIQQATSESLHDETVMDTARALMLTLTGNEMPSDEAIHALFTYSALLSANVATRITSVLLTESQFDSMCQEIQEFDDMEKGVLGD
jgi:hypothetical protein